MEQLINRVRHFALNNSPEFVEAFNYYFQLSLLRKTRGTCKREYYGQFETRTTVHRTLAGYHEQMASLVDPRSRTISTESRPRTDTDN